MSFLDRIRRCNTYNLSGFLPFVTDGLTVGWVRPAFAEHLAAAPQVFSIKQNSVSFAETLKTAKSRSAAIAEIAPDWVSTGVIRKLRREIYPVCEAWSEPDYFQIDRALVPYFGVRAYGVHLNGFVKRADGYHIWVGKRSADRQIEPDKLDNMVAGGQPAGLSFIENLIKESAEEASLPRDLAAQAMPVGTITYCFEIEAGLKPDSLFCYDLLVSDDFAPKNQDGEIASFQLMPLEEALVTISEGEAFKFNVSLVILDFAIRHGVVSPDTEPHYEEILAGLHAIAPLYSARLNHASVDI